MIIKSYLPGGDVVEISGIPVIKPDSVTIAVGKMANSEKHILFKCNNVDRSAPLKWKGYINERFCLGCELV